MALRSTIACLSLLIASTVGQAQLSTPLVTGKHITPLGRHVAVGSFPANMLLSPDGRFIVITNTGYREYLTVMSVATGRITSRISFNADRTDGSNKRQGLYYGLAWGPAGSVSFTLYASRGAEDTVSVLTLDAMGKLTDSGVLLENPSGVADFKAPHIIAGVAVGAGGARLYAANNETGRSTNLRGSLSIISTATKKVEAKIETPGYPYAVAVVPPHGASAEKVYVSSERDGVVTVVDPASARSVRDIRTGEQPISLVTDRTAKRLFVANAGSDTVSVIDTTTDTVTNTILLRPDDVRGLPGATPTGLSLSPDEQTLYVTLADMNCVALVDLKAMRTTGYLPVGWYPTSVVASPDGKKLFVANARGTADRTPNKGPGGLGSNAASRHMANLLEGTVAVVPLPATAAELTKHTVQTIRNNRLAEGSFASFKNPGIKHVIYIIKENRTYDQVLGDIPKGNGDPTLTLFPREVTPNQHALAERFVLLDNFYVCAEMSADGWNWSTSGMASEYISRNANYNYSNRGRNYDYEGTNSGVPTDLRGLRDVAAAPGGYVWDQCVKHGVSFRNYGFFSTSIDPATRLKDGEKADTEENVPVKKALVGKTDLNFRVYDNGYADSDAWVRHDAPHGAQMKTFGKFAAPSRFSEWKREFDTYVKSGSLPSMMFVRFGNDHTVGTRAGWPSPRAMVADNDYAVGQLVEAVSKSPFWKETAIFILEDDAQNGYDHIDGHRSTAYVISPYIPAGTVDSRFYNTDSMLRTMGLILGMAPMCQYDAIATPFRFFGAVPANSASYEAILPAKQIIAERNLATAYKAKVSARFSTKDADTVPDDLLTEILWHAVKGKTTPQPARRSGMRLAAPRKTR